MAAAAVREERREAEKGNGGCGEIKGGDDEGDAAFSVSSGGQLLRVSLFLRTPPSSSRVCFDCFPHIDSDGNDRAHLRVLAAHADSLLVEFFSSSNPRGNIDHFVYNASDAAADPPRPPSLLLLPVYRTESEEDEIKTMLDSNTTGLLLRHGGDDGGENDLVVADLAVVEGPRLKDAKLVILRSGEWSITRAPVVHFDGRNDDEPLPAWTTHAVVPVGDRRLCWIGLYRGIIVCDVFDEIPQLQFLSLPLEALTGEYDDDDYPNNKRNFVVTDRSVCVTNDETTLKLIHTNPRCCCGRAGMTFCDHSHGAFVIKTWALTMEDGDMTWTMDAMVDSTELWSQHAGFPHYSPAHPIIMSVEDPNVICFMVVEKYTGNKWNILFNTRSKTLLSMCSPGGHNYLASKISSYFTSQGKCSSGAEDPPVIVDKAATNDTVIGGLVQSSSYESFGVKHFSESDLASCKEIFAALEEIPELYPRDLLKAYSMLCHDNGRRFKSLLGLPMSLRKTWLLMEIQTCEACVVCSSLTTDLQNP
uniref:DUF1618 domain-containing protein n=1 Tax=Leersia perrieri TaxID=77586 RepID=A0A0D9XPL3_9ORYZ